MFTPVQFLQFLRRVAAGLVRERWRVERQVESTRLDKPVRRSDGSRVSITHA